MAESRFPSVFQPDMTMFWLYYYIFDDPFLWQNNEVKCMLNKYCNILLMLKTCLFGYRDDCIKTYIFLWNCKLPWWDMTCNLPYVLRIATSIYLLHSKCTCFLIKHGRKEEHRHMHNMQIPLTLSMTLQIVVSDQHLYVPSSAIVTGFRARSWLLFAQLMRCNLSWPSVGLNVGEP